MKRDEPYNPHIKSPEPPQELSFRLAGIQDRDAVTQLMAERNPDQEIPAVMNKTDREIALNASDPDYRLFVAELNGRVAGLCRYFHSAGLPKEKLLFAAPHGWYCMGIVVDKGMRRRGVARFLFQNRLKSLKEKGANLIYSMVDSENLASIRMHQEFGFEELERATGFLHIRFDGSVGILYRMFI